MSEDSPARVLVVDDHDAGRYFKTHVLDRAGFAVEEAINAAAARDAIERLSPDLIVLDVRLPDADGLELCREIKADRPATVVLQTSAAFTSAHDKALGLAGGADAYLVEPLEPEELVATVRALLRMREAEEELRRLATSLERKLEAESEQRASAEEALQHAHKLDAIGQLTGGIAHDFNNFLVVILGSLEKMERTLRQGCGEHDAELLRLTIAGRQAAQDCERLTNRLLAFARRESQQVDLFDANASIRSMDDFLRRALGERVMLDLALADDLWCGRGDANQFEVALLNLAVNARDAMPDGGTFRLSTENVPDGHRAAPRVALRQGDYVCIAATDTGIGMSPEILAHAFEPFFTTKDVGKGSGLGLAQVYGFARQAGGNVGVESTPGKGARLAIYLPRTEGTTTAERSAVRDEAATASAGGGETILMVEDNAMVREAVSMTMSDLGYRVLTAGDAREALDIIEGDERIDLLFSDMVMPNRLTGLQLAAAARDLRPEIKVLLTSGYPGDADVKGHSIGGYPFLAKPYLEGELAERLREVLDA